MGNPKKPKEADFGRLANKAAEAVVGKRAITPASADAASFN